MKTFDACDLIKLTLLQCLRKIFLMTNVQVSENHSTNYKGGKKNSCLNNCIER